MHLPPMWLQWLVSATVQHEQALIGYPLRHDQHPAPELFHCDFNWYFWLKISLLQYY